MKFKPSQKAKRIIELLFQAGASDCMFVGGFVRDFFLHIDSKDIDIEVYGMDYDSILAALSPHFRVDVVGRSFGVIKVDHRIDVSIPRRESKTGRGHRAFCVETDSELSPREAFGRRDFTINAIGMRLDGSICDPYDGQGDLRRRILRATTDAFAEDPLRVLRGMQFAARLGFEGDARTLELCRSLLGEFETLAPERIWDEWNKWAIKSRFPSKGLQFLDQCGWIEKFPEIAALRGCEQNPYLHPEGDVFAHTKMVCDEAVKISEQWKFREERHQELLFSALAHDFGKSFCTVVSEQGRISSRGHAEQGVSPALSFLQRIHSPLNLRTRVAALVREHMSQMSVPKGDFPPERLVRRLSTRLSPSTIRTWAALCIADSAGRGGIRNPRTRVDPWLEVAEKLSLMDKTPDPILRGRDLISLGMPPGPKMGELLREAFELQLDGEIANSEDALKWARERRDALPEPP